MERGPGTGLQIGSTRKITFRLTTRETVRTAESLNTNNHLHHLRFCSTGLVLACALVVSACQHRPAYEDRPYLDPQWVTSSYQLPLQENLRLKREARAAAAEGNREVCGAILQQSDNSRTLELFFVENASNRSHSYELSPRSVQRVRKAADNRDSKIIGSFHSHPSSDAAPSKSDITHAGVLSLLLIHSVPSDRTRLWQIVLRNGTKKAREVQLEVIGRRLRGPSPLNPSPRRPSLPPVDPETSSGQ